MLDQLGIDPLFVQNLRLGKEVLSTKSTGTVTSGFVSYASKKQLKGPMYSPIKLAKGGGLK